MELTDRQKCLLDLVKQLHDEDRKYNGGPYWEHVLRVANMVAENEKYTALGWEVGLCHDLIEDKKIETTILMQKLITCGYAYNEADRIVSVVLELTNKYTTEDYPKMGRDERKHMDGIRLGRTSYLAKTVKYADIIDNLPSVVVNDPEFGLIYWREKMNIVERMRDGNFDLLVRCCAVLHEAKQTLKSKGLL